MMTDEGVAMVDRFLDDAVLAHLTTVTIIHGKAQVPCARRCSST